MTGTDQQIPHAQPRHAETVHATAVAIEVEAGGDRVGVLLRGESGAGKSDLALRLIDGGAVLVADDRTVLHCAAGRVLLSAPEALRGRIEVRGIGIVPVPSVADIPLALVVDLVPSRAVERMPEARYETFCGMAVPALSLDPRESSAPAKVRLGVCAATCGILFGQD